LGSPNLLADYKKSVKQNWDMHRKRLEESLMKMSPSEKLIVQEMEIIEDDIVIEKAINRAQGPVAAASRPAILEPLSGAKPPGAPMRNNYTELPKTVAHH
jgi:hypothetical protein